MEKNALFFITNQINRAIRQMASPIMVLTKFNQVTLPKNRSYSEKRPRITLSKSGCISINNSSAKLLELSDGDKISFAQDDKGVWLVSKDSDGYTVKKKDKNGTMYLSHKELSKEINTSFELDSAETNVLLVLEEPKTIEKIKWFEITTQS